MGNKENYIVLESSSVYTLQTLVRDALESGYKLQGGVSALVVATNRVRYIQAMIKEKENEK